MALTLPKARAEGRLRLVLFDCDGTLVDSQHMIVAAMADAYARHDLPRLPRAKVLSIVGLSLPEAFAVLGEGVEDFPAAGLADAYKDAYFRLRASSPPEPMFEGAREVLDGLRRRDDTVLGIVTGKSRRGVDRLLDNHGMEGWFATIQTADDAPSKPDPAMVLQALAETGAAAVDTVIVGDTTFDMSMARAAGASALAVSWGYHPRDALLAVGAQGLVDDFMAVPAAVDALLAAAQASVG